MIVKLKKRNTRYRDLTFGQPYLVIGIEADEFRILNEAGRPFLYSPNLFSSLTQESQTIGLTEFGLNKAGFFEDSFGQKTKAAAAF